jgi:Nif-specific regulatory protein
MNPRLTAIAGPLKGTNYPLQAVTETTIGRESANQLCITDSSVSRRHCVISRDAEDQFRIKDLESLNGTFVNDVPVKERELVAGDRVRIGHHLFLFLTGEEETPIVSSPVQLDETNVLTGATVQLRVKDALYLMARDLSALMKISMRINSVRGLEQLERELLELILEVVPAEQGAILLVEGGSEEFTSVFGWDREMGAGRTVRVSRTISQKVMRERTAILSNDLQESGSFDMTESLIASQSRSVMCMPLVVLDKVLGVIYLCASSATNARFDEDHLKLLTAIANIAAVALENARHVEWLQSENRRLQEDIHLEHNMIGESRKMQSVYQFISRVAPTDATVLIDGESGTGKEMAARAIHLNSRRGEKAFVAINCAALTESLLESEMFGHEKGAFTGALGLKKGKLEVADGGTVFLDEIGEMAQPLQAKLLRVLQEREFERVGGTRTIKIDIRLIAATNRDLEEAIKQGVFRQDLYYRLNVVSIRMPPLRERPEDIPLLASYFAAKYSKKCKPHAMGVSTAARSLLMHYDWPGNVRELENAIERAVVLGSTDVILPEDLPEAVLEKEVPESAGVTKYHEAITEAKKQLITKALEQAKGNYTEAARLLGVHPNYLHRLVSNMNLRSTLKK